MSMSSQVVPVTPAATQFASFVSVMYFTLPAPRSLSNMIIESTSGDTNSGKLCISGMDGIQLRNESKAAADAGQLNKTCFQHRTLQHFVGHERHKLFLIGFDGLLRTKPDKLVLFELDTDFTSEACNGDVLSFDFDAVQTAGNIEVGPCHSEGQSAKTHFNVDILSITQVQTFTSRQFDHYAEVDQFHCALGEQLYEL